MKTIKPLIIFLSIPLALWACRKDNDFELKPDDTFTIKNSGASVCYQNNIGKDSASTVDSIKRLYGQTRPDLWADSIRTQRLDVDFPYDNRLFWLLPVRAKQEYPSPLFFWLDVVDSKGNHYKYQHSPD